MKEFKSRRAVPFSYEDWAMIALLIAAAIEAGVCVHSMNQMVRSINPVAEVYAESVPDAQV
jgi:hypothetical protein